jgi:hypothetical protein
MDRNARMLQRMNNFRTILRIVLFSLTLSFLFTLSVGGLFMFYRLIATVGVLLFWHGLCALASAAPREYEAQVTGVDVYKCDVPTDTNRYQARPPQCPLTFKTNPARDYDGVRVQISVARQAGTRPRTFFLYLDSQMRRIDDEPTTATDIYDRALTTQGIEARDLAVIHSNAIELERAFKGAPGGRFKMWVRDIPFWKGGDARAADTIRKVEIPSTSGGLTTLTAEICVTPTDRPNDTASFAATCRIYPHLLKIVGDD